jgi:hypothetical protein
MVEEQTAANKIASKEIELLSHHRAEDLAAAQASADAGELQEAAEAKRRATMIAARVKTHVNAMNVSITNDSPSAVTQVEVVNVACSGQPEWSWEFDEYAHSRLEELLDCDVLPSHRKHVFHVQFTNEAGDEQQIESGMDFEVTYRFTDWRGRRWERMSNGDPRPLDS